MHLEVNRTYIQIYTAPSCREYRPLSIFIRFQRLPIGWPRGCVADVINDLRGRNVAEQIG